MVADEWWWSFYQWHLKTNHIVFLYVFLQQRIVKLHCCLFSVYLKSIFLRERFGIWRSWETPKDKNHCIQRGHGFTTHTHHEARTKGDSFAEHALFFIDILMLLFSLLHLFGYYMLVVLLRLAGMISESFSG